MKRLFGMNTAQFNTLIATLSLLFAVTGGIGHLIYRNVKFETQTYYHNKLQDSLTGIIFHNQIEIHDTIMKVSERQQQIKADIKFLKITKQDKKSISVKDLSKN